MSLCCQTILKKVFLSQKICQNDFKKVKIIEKLWNKYFKKSFHLRQSVKTQKLLLILLRIDLGLMKIYCNCILVKVFLQKSPDDVS